MDTVELLLKLLSFDTSRDTRELAGFVGGLFRKAGFSVERVGEGEACLLVKKGAPSFSFLAHMDTVPAGSGWTKDQYGELNGSRIYGRGAVDTKGGMAAAMTAVMEAGEGSMIFTFGEETDFAGVNLLKGKKLTEPIIVIEPTDMKVGIAGKGLCGLRVAVKGISSHASRPEEGINAITRACEAIRALSSIERSENAILGKTTVNVGTISGGTAPNVVPDSCEFSVDIRYVGEEHRKIIEELEKFGTVRVSVEYPPFRSAPELAQVFMRRGYEPVVLRAYTEAGILSQAGKRCVVLGPGKIERAHTADEYITVDELEGAKRKFAGLLESLK